jgi:hypothetical protein
MKTDQIDNFKPQAKSKSKKERKESQQKPRWFAC